MKNTMKKLALVIALMGGSSLVAQIPIEINKQALQKIDNCKVAEKAAAFSEDIAMHILKLLATRPGDEHYNTLTFKAIVEEFNKRIALFEASGLRQEIKDLVDQKILDADAQAALEGFLDLIKDKDPVCKVLTDQAKRNRASYIQLLVSLNNYKHWLPEVYRIPVVSNDAAKQEDLKNRLRERTHMK